MTKEQIEKRITTLRLAMAISGPTFRFFAQLLYKLKTSYVAGLPGYAGTDGTNLYVDTELWDKLENKDQEMTILGHEVMHCAAGHMSRRGDRDPIKWNIACDLAINKILRDAGCEMYPKAIYPGGPNFDNFDPTADRSAEWYYENLTDEQCCNCIGKGKPQYIIVQLDGNGPGQGMQVPNLPGGGIMDTQGKKPATDGDQEDSKGSGAQKLAEDWKIATSAAAQVAFGQSKMPGSLQRFLGELLNPKVPWQEELYEFVVSKIKTDYTWLKFNRRWLADGHTLPGMDGDQLGGIVAVIDTSGSITDKMVAEFFAEIFAILDLNPMSLTLMLHNVPVYYQHTWQPGDGELDIPRINSGGTSHIDVFDKIAKLDNEPMCVVCLTDLMTDFPPVVPDLPVLWVVPTQYEHLEPPFGRKVIFS